MSAGGDVHLSAGRTYGSVLILLLALAGGLLLLHRQEVLSGFKVAIGEPGDDRLINWVLEHNLRWLRGERAHADLWSPPFFHPEANVAAYSETLLGIEPIYVAARLAGLAPELAFKVLALMLSALNFAAFFLLAKRFLGFDFGAAVAGACLFSFSSPRAVQITQLQMTAGFFEVVAVAALVAIFEYWRGGRAWIALFWSACLVQLYAGVYHAWFFLFLLGLAVAIALANEGARKRLFAVLRCEPATWTVGALLTAVAAWPLATHYLAAGSRVGGRPLARVWLMLPRPESWLNLGPGSLLFGRLSSQLMGTQLPLEWVHRLGLGFVTWALVLCGAVLALNRRIEPVRIMVLAFGLAVFLAMRWPGGLSLWRWVYEFVPGATAIRAVARLAVVGLLPLALCFALAWQRLAASRRWHRLLVPLAALAVLEQVQTPQTYRLGPVLAGTARLAEWIPADCAAFFYSSGKPGELPHHVHLDAMWATLATGIPTLNGYSGSRPPDWPLIDAVVDVPAEGAALREALRGWVAVRQITESVCWIRWDGVRGHPAEVDRLSGFASLPGSGRAPPALVTKSR